jgi:hypothetical protein
MDIVIVDFQVVLRNPTFFSIEFAPDGFGSPDFVFHDIKYELVLIDDHCIMLAFILNCHVQSLCLIDLDFGNYVFTLKRIEIFLCQNT